MPEGKCIYDFFLNENISLVEYRSFQEFGHSGYPSISFCILYPFLENKLRMHGSGINVTRYVMFLNGSLSDERMAKIDYDNVTISLSDSCVLLPSEMNMKINFLKKVFLNFLKLVV